MPHQLYAHELIQTRNRGLRDERIVYTGREEVFDTEAEALASAKRTWKRTGVLPGVCPYCDDF